jgi:hypothetical protein
MSEFVECHEVPERLFSLAAANAYVPKLTEIFSAVRDDLAQIREHVESLEASGYGLTPGKPVEEDPEAPEAVRAHQRGVQELAYRISAATEEVASMGIEVKGVDGLVDFRSRRNGEIVYLCWRFGEDHISHWHDLETGFPGRTPIRANDEFEGDLLQ